jgi:hypothetical protein
MLYQLGALFGYIIIVLYVFTILNFFFKLVFKKCRKQLAKNQSVYKLYTKLMKVFVKYHKWFGLLTILFILAHFFVQFTQLYLSIPGVIAAGTMILQIGLGIYGSKAKKRGKIWLISHRSIAVLLLIAIVVHIF